VSTCLRTPTSIWLFPAACLLLMYPRESLAGPLKVSPNGRYFVDGEASCQRVEIDPFTWFQDVLTRIATHPVTRFAELLPHTWKIARA
jgi:IS66 C-terminal element